MWKREERRLVTEDAPRTGWRKSALMVLVVGLILAACGSGEEPSDDGLDDTTVEDGTEDADDSADTDEDAADDGEESRLTFALDPPDPETGLIWAAAGSSIHIQMEPYLESLLDNDQETGEYVAGLASDWEHNDDFTEWRFQLREGVQWHKGFGEFTSEDVIFSHEMWSGPDALLPFHDVWVAAEVEAEGPYEVVFRWDEPQLNIDQLMSRQRSQGFIYSAAQFEEAGIDALDDDPAGTGRYIFRERNVGEGMIFDANPDHWSGDVPDFDVIEFRWEPEESTRLALLQSGEADIAALGLQLYDQALSAGFEVWEAEIVNYQSYMYFGGAVYAEHDSNPPVDESVPWLADPNVRGALNKAINRDDLRDFVYEGLGQLSPISGFTPETEGWSDQWLDDFDEYYGYDPERAVEMIREAGYEPEDLNPTLMSFTFPGSPEFPSVVEAVQAMWAEIGIDADIQETDGSGIREAAAARDNAGDVVPFRNVPVRPSVDWVVGLNMPQASYTHYNTDELVAITDSWRVSIDPDERQELAQQAGDMFFYEYGSIPLMNMRTGVVANPDAVADWQLPGVTGSGMSHFGFIKAH